MSKVQGSSQNNAAAAAGREAAQRAAEEAARRAAEEAARRAAEEAARRAAEEAARKAAEQTQKAAEAQQQANRAQELAHQKHEVAAKAEKTVRPHDEPQARTAVADKAKADPARAREQDHAKQAAAQAKKEAHDAQRHADELQRKATAELDKAQHAQKTANAEARKISKSEPFPEAEKIRDLYEGAKKGLQQIGEKFLGEKEQKTATTADARLEKDSAEATGRREGRAMADRAAEAAEKKLGKPLDQASPMEADKALSEALKKEQKELPKDALKGIKPGDKKEQAREFAKAYGDEARKALHERLGESNAKVALNNNAGRTLGEVSAKNAASAARNEFGKEAAQEAKAAAKSEAYSKPTPAESAEVIREATKAGPKEGAQALRDQLRGINDKQRAEVIQHSRDAIKEIGSKTGQLTNQDDFREVTDALAEAGEAAGTGHADDIAKAFAEGLPPLVHSDGSESANLDFAQALRGSVESGKGALFATEFANEIRDMPQHVGTPPVGLRETVQMELGKGLKEVRQNFEEKAKEVDRLNQELGVRLQEWKGTLSPAQLEKAAKAFQDHPDYKKAVRELEEASGTLSSTLPGAARAVEIREHVPEGLKSDEGDGDADEMSFVGASANDVLTQLPRLGQTDAGQRAIADGLEAQGRGEESFLTSLNRGALDVKDAKEFKAGLQDSFMRSAASRSAELSNKQDMGRMENLLNGLNANAENMGLKKDSLQDLTDVAKKYKNDKKFDPARFAADFTGGLKSVASKSLTEKLPEGVEARDTPAGKRLAALGIAVTGGSLADRLTSSQLKDKLRGTADVLGIAGDISTILPENQLGSLFRGAGNLAKPVGVIFDSVGIAQSLQKKDYLQAGFSAATLGANLIAASAGGPLAVGATAAVSTLGQLTINQVRAAQEEKNAEQRTESFLRGAGIQDPDALLRLRDLNGDHQSIGHILRQTADVSGGYSPAQLLQQVSKADSKTLEEVVKKAEDLERNKDGTYKPGSVAEFHQYLIDRGLISPPATNGSPNYA